MRRRSIDQPYSTRSTNSVPRDHGVRWAARGLEREDKGFGATQEKNAIVEVVSFWALENGRPNENG
jgi:hypothetical protein